MEIVGFFDLHRQQITFDYVDRVSGEVQRGRLRPATRASLRTWLERFDGRPAEFGVEGCTGWRFVTEELARVAITAHLAEPAELAARRGPKRRAKTDWADARRGREALERGELPESWIPPEHLLEIRSLCRLYADLMSDRNGWQQRIHATCFHQGVPPIGRDVLTADHRAAVETAALSRAGRHSVDVALAMVDQLDQRLEPLRATLQTHGRRQTGCRALQGHYGIAELTATIIWAELGDCRRFHSSDQAVRHTGLDVTVHDSDGHRTRGHLSRQGPPLLRWALFEAAKCAARTTSPDHAYYRTVHAREGAGRATLSVARKLVRRCHHTLVALGDAALEPARP